METEDNGTTPEEAKAVWDSLEAPTIDKVYERLISAGKKVALNRLRAWYRANWFIPTSEGQAAALNDAIAEVDTKVPMVTGNPRNGLRNMMPDQEFRSANFFSQVGKMNEKQLLRTAPREALAAAAVLFHECKTKRKMLMEKPKEFGDLLRSLGELMEKSVDCFERSVGIAERADRSDQVSRRKTVDITPSVVDEGIASLLRQ